MKAVIIIPARFHSTRLPGKPLQLIRGKSMLQRMWQIAKQVSQVAGVYIATEDKRIVEHAHTFQAHALLTPDSCINGTERVLAAAELLNPRPEIILNLQGDAVLTPPWVIQALLNAMLANEALMFATTAVRMARAEYEQMALSKKRGQVGGTTVVFDQDHRALYFSKSMIPFLRETREEPLPVYRHIGLYAYRYAFLKQYASLPPTLLEKTEGLEPLRALEHGLPIHVVEVDYQKRTHWSVDSAEDVGLVEAIIDREGELV
jgi:3-deoxy-manno-octulosonate cytidylyltransferase (CMP-KDO synthetase)